MEVLIVFVIGVLIGCGVFLVLCLYFFFVVLGLILFFYVVNFFLFVIGWLVIG